MTEPEPLIVVMRGVTAEQDSSMPPGVVEVRLDDRPVDWFAVRKEDEHE